MHQDMQHFPNYQALAPEEKSILGYSKMNIQFIRIVGSMDLQKKDI